ncbi:M14 family metallopeptidase [Candidatus Phycosocius spiralis]|uniref:Deacylase/carboxypeptidase superfamily protein n=1 Tax=Candidatus Phycosocius spiralis TaxID=2815099 RepID=A0ABQ4PUQ2_9PROT|nr:M14 family metallopeptidase [Candidatus Phycosocius spiralis]GIU66752.1 deacylase/carboxypeptidase superfamily protein [Candidatus Phycosocius spiralis]
MSIFRVILAALAAVLVLPQMGHAQSRQQGESNLIGTLAPVSPEFYWPGANYDPAVPTPHSVLGYQIGQAITPHASIIDYFEALAAYAPTRVRLVDYGRSWQGKRLIYVVIGSPENIANLSAIQADVQKLADPRTLTTSEADAIIARHPAVVWLAYSVHGDEIGPAESSMQLAYHLLAARGDQRMAEIAKNTLIVIVPMQNPDGRDRFIATNIGSSGLAPVSSPIAAERDQPWPGGRVNHAQFDLNRDWFALTQPETRAQIAAYLSFYPVVMVDSHEMGSDRNFFFPPEANPINPNVTQEQIALKTLLGQHNARWFDQIGLPYFTRESYDLFYPGYGDGWPTAQGTISMTFEQGSARGLMIKRSDGTFLTYQETIKSQFVAVLSTLEVAARERMRFVRSFYAFRQSAIQEGRSEAIKSYLVPTQADQSNADKLAGILTRQGIDVARATTRFSACGRNYAPGSYVISAAQPTKRLIRNLLEVDTKMEPAFVAKQERLRRAGLEDEIYDVTAWSLPLLYNVEVQACTMDPNVTTQKAGTALILPGKLVHGDSKVAYVIASGSTATTRFMAQALQAGMIVRQMEGAFKLEGQTFGAGSLVVLGGENAPSLEQNLARLADSTGATIIGFKTTWVTEGPSLGSDKALKLRNPKIALAWDSPTDRNSAGAMRYVIERKFGVPITPIRVRRFAKAALSEYDVIILPDGEGDYQSAFGQAGIANLNNFVQQGGVLMSVGSATSWLAEPDVGLTGLRREQATMTDAEAKSKQADPKSKPGSTTIEGLNLPDVGAFVQAIASPVREPTELDGAILRAQTDQEHWLTAGLAPNLTMMVSGSAIYRPLTMDAGTNVVRFSGPDQVKASGIVWDDSRQQYGFKPVVTVEGKGRGFVVAFTIDPTYRGMADGLDSLVMNAIYFSAARARPTR